MMLISFDLCAQMGFLKKPDINDGIYLTYNMLHKPALLGMLGAIIGLRGYCQNGELPEYYQKLKHLKVGIQPLKCDKGNYVKETLCYNNGTGFASNEDGGNLVIKEQVLLRPSYRCFVLLDLSNPFEKTLYDNILSFRAEFLPYLGKNEFSVWWTNVQAYEDAHVFNFEKETHIVSLFRKEEAVSKYIVRFLSISTSNISPFLYFERLPIEFSEELYQYEYGDFVYSNATFKPDMVNSLSSNDFYDIGNSQIVQLI